MAAPEELVVGVDVTPSVLGLQATKLIATNMRNANLLLCRNMDHLLYVHLFTLTLRPAIQKATRFPASNYDQVV